MNITPLSPEKYCNERPGEVKIGSQLTWMQANWREQLLDSKIRFVILGVKEDIGPRANLGNGGADQFFESFLAKFTNFQENQFLSGANTAVLGMLDFTPKSLFQTSTTVDQLRHLVQEIDRYVLEPLMAILKAGKTPILVGGGHNNAFPMIKALATQLQQKVQVLNFDAHADFRNLEGRHSGNPFSAAHEEGFLGHYSVLGLHRNYTSAQIQQNLSKANANSLYLEEIDTNPSKISFIKQWLDVKLHSKFPLGIEIDLDGIAGTRSSAQSPYGFVLNDLRILLRHLAGARKLAYLNLTEGIPDEYGQSAKTAAYLLADFIKEQSQYDHN